jgi:rhamnosyltransferase
VLLSDQDSNYPNDYVKTMLIQYQKAISRNEQIAAIGPIYMDTNKGSVSQGFVISNGILNQRIFPARGVYQVAQLISSGMIIPITVFREVGLMLDELFVDWHDLEWCWRARAKGYLVLGCADTYIRHKLGTRVRKTIFGDLTIRSPLRHYYMVRNAIYLALNARYLKTSFRIVLFLKALRNSVIYAIYGKSHFGNVFFCLKGIIDGLLFRMGKCDSNWGLINISDFLKEID